ncbi:MAG: hypothetical protein LCH46_11055 [Proteobacteria bacterium]|nr:hypothetical protein [Pseudomonadota bacterium]
MKPGLPWSIKGIEPDAREAAKQAARRSGMTLGEWLNSTILDQQSDGREESAQQQPRGRVPKPQEAALERTASRLEDIAETLARLSQNETSTASRIGIRSAGQAEQDSAALQRVLNRVESNERQTVEAFTAVNERLSTLGRQVTNAIKTAPRPEESPGYQALEKAVRGIVEHMESSEKRNRDQMKSMQDRLASLSQKAQTSGSDQLLRQAPAFTQLENRLGDLARRMEQSEQARPAGLKELLKVEIAGLVERIDTVRDTAEALAARAQTQAVQASQQELRAIETRIVGLVKEAQSSITSSPAEMQRLRGEIERLNRRIDEVNAIPQDTGEVQRLRSAVEQLSTRVAQGPDMRPLAEMDRRILDLTQRIEQSESASQQSPHFNELEGRIAELDYRFNEMLTNQAAGHPGEIESRLAEVTDRVARTEQHLSSIETIERAVNQLFESFDQHRTWTQQVAEDAANRMADRLLAQGPQPVTLAGSPEISALEQGLDAVRQAAESSDQRNQETLEAVHETLEQIVTKLAELETAAIGQRVAAAAAPQGFAEPMAAAVNNPLEPQIPEFNLGPAAATDVPAPQSEIPPLQNPLEAGPSPAESSPFLEPAMPAADAAPLSGDDFIAAARRAAQASAQQKSIFAGVAPGMARASEVGSKKLFNISLFKRKPKQKTDPVGLSGEIKPPPGFKPANNNDAKRRKLIILGFLLLAMVSAVGANLYGRTNKAKPVEPAALEQPLQPNVKKSSAPAGQAQKASEMTKTVEAAKPAALGLPEPDIDSVLTASTAPTEDAIQAIVAGEEQGSNMPPAEVGSMKLREAAALGNADAQFVIATRYHNGDRVPQDFAKAAFWYGKAAAQGLAPAQYRVATLYEKGKGVPRDLRAALGWYERAAALGNVKSMHNAAVLSAGNEIGKPDYEKAYKWFSLAAAHGLKDSEYNLAVLLERGLGTPKDSKDAMFWYMLAAQQDDQEGLKRANAIAKTLTQTERQSVQDRLAQWKPEKPRDTANVVAVNNRDWTEEPKG